MQYVCVGTCMHGYFNCINIMAYDESELKCTNNFSWMTWLYGIFLLYEHVMIRTMAMPHTLLTSQSMMNW